MAVALEIYGPSILVCFIKCKWKSNSTENTNALLSASRDGAVFHPVSEQMEVSISQLKKQCRKMSFLYMRCFILCECFFFF